MLFQTWQFLALMLVVLAGLVIVRSAAVRLALLVVASWVFYAFWDPRFLFLLVFTNITDFILGIRIGGARSGASRKAWLACSLVTNLGVLAVFKYYDFFANTLNDVLAADTSLDKIPLLGVALPIGISFYTFHSMGYNIDVYRRKIEPERNPLRFALYVAFFPQLVAGPILRSTDFLPQTRNPIVWSKEKIASGANLFLVGLVKKIVIADNVSPLADFVFDKPMGLPSLAIAIGAVAFGVQIYCDFSGYTDMARGAARILGFEIPINFDFPYFSRSITEFWRRWHISLSRWLRDYLYISLGGNRRGRLATYRNLLATMVLGGLWHGAGWNFGLWGWYHGALLAVERWWRDRKGENASVGTPVGGRLRLIATLVCTQYLVFLGWVIFRVHSMPDLAYCMKKLIVFDGNLGIASLGFGNVNPFLAGGSIVLFVALHVFSKRVGGAAQWLDSLGSARRWVIYVIAVFVLCWLWPSKASAFIYFQF